MRIRKNAKLSSLINSTGSRAEAVHMCELNQSPWDVLPFAQEPYPSYPHHQFEPKYSFNGNGSLGDSVGVVESVASMMYSEDKSIMKVEGMVIDDDVEMKIGNQYGFQTQYEDEEKGSKQDCSLKSSSYDNDNNPSNNTGNRRGRARAAKKRSASASKPYEFYYYSGFGPSWGRRRGGRSSSSKMRKNMIVEGKDVENNGSVVTTQNNNTTPSSSSQFDNNEEFDFVDDEDDDEEEDDDGNVDSGGKKRMRKPIKARSLKSLM